MTRRMLDSSLWTNEHFGEMPMMARLLLLGIINHADDQGRIKAHSVFLKTQIFPYDDDIGKEEVESCLSKIEANGTIQIYEANGKRYIQLLNWWEYQTLLFAAPSEYPRPDGWQDRIRYNSKGGGILTCNWVTVGGELLNNTCDEDGNALPTMANFPPKNPGGRPPKNPPEKSGENPRGKSPGNINRNRNRNKKEDQERDAPAAPPTSPPNPAVVVFRDVWKRNPNKPAAECIAKRVTDLELWREACEAWGVRGHSPTNVNGMLDWYDHPERFRTEYWPPPNGGDYRPGATTNRGANAAVGFMQRKGMLNGRD